MANDKPGEEEEENNEEELDYTENIDEALHHVGDAGDFNEASSDRRVINFDQTQSGLATITINFQSNESEEEDDGKQKENKRSERTDTNVAGQQSRNNDHQKDSSDEDIELRKGLLGDMSKVDARYAILKSRLENDTAYKDKKRHTKGKKERSRDKCLGSMVADIEENSRLKKQKQNNSMYLRERRRILEARRKKVSVTRDRDSYLSENKESQKKRNEELQSESRRIKLHELSRSMQPPPGDLRNLIGDKADRGRRSSSEDEDTIQRKLREKIKEEKHKRLFGKLNNKEQIKLKKERDSLREKLNRRRGDCSKLKVKNNDTDNMLTVVSKKHVSSQETNDIVRKTNKTGLYGSISKSNEESENYSEQNEKNEGSDECNIESEEKSICEDGNKVSTEPQYENCQHSDEKDGHVENSIEKNKQFLSVKEEVDEKEVSADTLKSGMHNNNNDSSPTNRNAVPPGVKQEKKKSERKSKHKSSKRRRMKHEFIVTLDGRSLSIQTGSSHSHEKSSKRRRVDCNYKKHGKSISFTQSDDEFEEILRRKDAEEEKREERCRKMKEHTHLKDEGSDELTAVDKEILLAEKKLNAQKVLRKSLKQVQNINVIEKVKHKTAFINPHFQSKVSHDEPNLVQLTGHSFPAQIPLYPSLKPEQQLSPVLSPTTFVQVDTGKIQSSDVVRTISSTDLINRATQSSETSISNGPSCKTFPSCSFGDQCMYVHPECKYGERCTMADCNFSHYRIFTSDTSFATQQQSSGLQICKFLSRCDNVGCPYVHPGGSKQPCRFGSFCNNPKCSFSHENKAASGSSLKWTASKPNVSERKFAVGESEVSQSPVAIVTIVTSHN